MQTDKFLPLADRLPSPNPSKDFRVLVVENAKEIRPFRTHATGGCGTLAAAVAARPKREPRVLLQREGDRVVGIRIECSCGQLIELACLYEPSIPTDTKT